MEFDVVASNLVFNYPDMNIICGILTKF